MSFGVLSFSEFIDDYNSFFYDDANMGMNIITVLQIMDETVDAVDRIAELPTFILHHIISCLHAAEVARTSILSKRWNQLRISFPILEF